MREITLIHELAGCDITNSIRCLQNVSLHNLLKLVFDIYIKCVTEESPTLRVSTADSPAELSDRLLSFYKGSRFLI